MLNGKAGLALCILAGLGAIAFTLFVDSPYYVQVVVWIFTNALLAASLRFVLLIGELNIATAAFFGIGAYTVGIATTIYDWPFLVAIVAAPLVAAAVSALFGWITLKTKGPYFLLISFAFTEVVRLVYSKSNAIGGNSGLVGIFPPMALDPWFPALVVTIMGATLLVLFWIEKTNLGRLFKAIENNEDIVRSVGLNVTWLKVLCVIIASAAVGLGGGLHAYANSVITPGDFTFFVAVLALAYVKIGGEGHALGPIVGAVLLTVAGQWVAGLGMQENIFYGAIIIGAILLMPQGLVGIASRLAGGMFRQGGEKTR
ncbi:MAG: branched-chain amino acid ABC transporter permease [Alphaproteobacteria bacterium]|nr:branched-chain amino acid ABC transporter permease [Alphaproteobacteria bacterium]MDX5370668.1 branched-chain amino acid ABC transporter permease [Alphaproteobacteria bacterium]MDX5465105.1 branched-chain amino acid ABC transporter permease [Alphaproteobacteria bacterium]